MITSVDSNEIAKTEAIDFVRRLVQHWQETLGAELLGAYLIGSLAHAGFNQRYSDIDLAIVTEAGLSQDALEGLKSEAVALSGDWGSNLYDLGGSCAELCWRRNPRAEGSQDVPTDDPLSRSLLLQLDDRRDRLERRRRDLSERKTRAGARY
jgi:predicted nucleotidyltransferase